jgi:glycosyltransferase involved in cell wall biosynthesis
MFQFTCALSKTQQEHEDRYTLLIELVGQNYIRQKLHCNPKDLIAQINITDPGSYFIHMTLVSREGAEGAEGAEVDNVANAHRLSTRTTMSFEAVTEYDPISVDKWHYTSAAPFFTHFLDPFDVPPLLRIAHISDLGRMDGYKGHLLQQLRLLPRGKYTQTVVDLSCAKPDKQPFRTSLEDWDIPIVSECIQVPADRWSTLGAWVNDLRLLDQYTTLDDIETPMRNALSILIDILLKSDIMIITNGAGDYDSYLIPLGRLTSTRVIMDLGPRGPVALPWTTRGLSKFVAQSTFVSSHPMVVASGVPTVILPPIIDVNAFSKPSAVRACRAASTNENKNDNDNENDSSPLQIRIGFVGRLATQKGPGMFIRAAAIASRILSDESTYENDINVTFVIAGIGTVENEVRSLAERHAVNIEWLGYVPNTELSCVLHRLDIFVFSSLFAESFGMSPVEAMLMRLPVIGFGVGGSQDFLIHEKTAVVVRERTPSELARAMVDLARDPKKRDRLGRSGEEFVRGAYNPSNILKGFETLYHGVMKS